MCNSGIRRYANRLVKALAAAVLGITAGLALMGTPAQAAVTSMQPLAGMVSTPSGHGYWQVAADGGVFAFGDAKFYGSMGGQHLNSPVVGMATTPNGGGYWLVAADGGVFAFGNAGFYGSMGGKPLAGAVDTIARAPAGDGYWLGATDGGVFAFGSATYYGRATYTPPQPPAGTYSFILPRGSVNPSWLGLPHHTYPAIDIPVPSGTRYYAITGGTVATFTDSTCGNGLTLYGDDGARYTYCHASSLVVKSGRVSPGTLLGFTGATGDATGAHLHLQVDIPGATHRCPQTFLQAMFNGSPVPAVGSLPTSGCVK